MTVNMLHLLGNHIVLTDCLLWGLGLCMPLKQTACPLNVLWPEGILHVWSIMMGELREVLNKMRSVLFCRASDLCKSGQSPTSEDVAAYLASEFRSICRDPIHTPRNLSQSSAPLSGSRNRTTPVSFIFSIVEAE